MRGKEQKCSVNGGFKTSKAFPVQSDVCHCGSAYYYYYPLTEPWLLPLPLYPGLMPVAETYPALRNVIFLMFSFPPIERAHLSDLVYENPKM